MNFLKKLTGGICYGCGSWAYSDECCQSPIGKLNRGLEELKKAKEKIEEISQVRHISERDRIYDLIEQIGGMEELEKMVARKQSYGGYEAMVDAETRKLWDNAQDQDYKQDAGKVRLSTVPPSLERAVAEIRICGIAKYGDNERWREVSVERYFDALLRHINAMREHGLESLDAESGCKHLHHAACNIAFIIDILEKRPCPSVNTAKNHG